MTEDAARGPDEPQPACLRSSPTAPATHAIFCAVEGPTGVGKTTLATQLAHELDAVAMLDPFAANPFLAPLLTARLRARRQVEQTLAMDAADRGWAREVERHRCTADRLERLLTDLGQPVDDTPEDHLDLST